MRLIKETDGLVSSWGWKYVFNLPGGIDNEGYFETRHHAVYIQDLEYKGYSTLNNTDIQPNKNKEFYI